MDDIVEVLRVLRNSALRQMTTQEEAVARLSSRQEQACLRGGNSLFRVRQLPLVRRVLNAFPSEEAGIDGPEAGPQHGEGSAQGGDHEADQAVCREGDKSADANESHQCSHNRCKEPDDEKHGDGCHENDEYKCGHGFASW